ncbi:hypothetical protein PENTCL1PPCAC_9912, partial [Pristionchus entomophagus]
RLSLLLCCLAAAAAARTPVIIGREGMREVTYCKDLHADIVLVIDASGSITAPIFNTHTKRFAKSVIERFDVAETRTRIGIVVYSATVYYQLPLTECGDVACLLSAIDSLSYAAGGTCTGDGIAAATEMLLKAEAPKGDSTRSRAIIVITDGHEECGYGPSTVPKRCNEARGKDIDIYAVAVGTTTFYTKAAAITDLDAICGGDTQKRFVVENYEALDAVFVERLQRQVCSTTWQVYGRCARDGNFKNECYTDSACSKRQPGTVCRGGCCVESRVTVPDPIILNECTYVAGDFILVISADSYVSEFHVQFKNFVRDLVSRYPIGWRKSRFGIVIYATTIISTISLEECADLDCLYDRIDALSFPGGKTCTGNAIVTATSMFDLATPIGKDRPKSIIVMTSRLEECGGQPGKRCNEARAAGIEVFTVIIANPKQTASIKELNSYVDGDLSKQFMIAKHDMIDYKFVDKVQSGICTAIPIGRGRIDTCKVECRTSSYCRRQDRFTECSNGCCVPSWKTWDDKKIVRPPRAITYCYGLHADIVLVIDASGSITAPIFNQQTKMFAKSLVGRFDVGPLKTRIGIVAYAATVYYTQDVTECYDVNCLYAKIDALSYPAGGTCTGDAIVKATDILNNAPAPNFYERNRAKVVIVITDGHEECGAGKSTVPARCDAARENDIELYAVAVGDTFRNKAAAIADLNAIADNDENNKFLANDYNALDQSFVERLQREVCSTEFRRWGREDCERECRTDSCCSRGGNIGSVCRNGCCIKPDITVLPPKPEPIFVAECKYVNADVVLVIDASGSITAPIFNKHTKNFANDLIDRFQVSATRTRIGLVAYAASVFHTTSVTQCADRECLHGKINTLNYPAGGTCTGDAVAEATKLLLAAPSPDGEDRPKVIIVITDGHEECGGGGSTVRKQCDAARSEGIDIFAVAVGTDTFLTKPAAIADLNAICNSQDDHKFIAKDYASLDYAFVDELQKEVCTSTIKTGLGDDCKAECRSHLACAFYASGTKCVNGCCRVPVEPVTPGGGVTPGGSTCGNKRPTAWCRNNKGQCNRQMSMRTECARTCGYCDGGSEVVEPKPKCFDKKSSGWCRSNVNKCYRGGFAARMRCGCAATCGFCSTEGGIKPTPPPVVATCEDGHWDCVNKPALCLNRAYKSLMLQHCPKTCGWCNELIVVEPPLITSPPIILPPITTVPPVVNNCVDTATDCGIKAGLCHNNAYKSLMMKRCQRTCGWC